MFECGLIVLVIFTTFAVAFVFCHATTLSAVLLCRAGYLSQFLSELHRRFKLHVHPNSRHQYVKLSRRQDVFLYGGGDELTLVANKLGLVAPRAACLVRRCGPAQPACVDRSSGSSLAAGSARVCHSSVCLETVFTEQG